jgi:hypothetical protein
LAPLVSTASMRIEVSTAIRRPASAVFDFVAARHFDNHPRWDPSVLSMEPVTPGPVGVGTRARVRRKRGDADEILEVMEFDPPRRFRTRDNIGPFLLDAEALVQPVGEEASHLTIRTSTEVSGPMKVVAPLLRPIFKRQVRKSAARIKEMVEGEGAGAP